MFKIIKKGRMVDIQTLLDKYDSPYVPGEKRGKCYNKQLQQESRKNRRLVLLDNLINEMKPLTINSHQKEHLRYLISTYSNSFKKLHGNVGEETIILAFIFYVLKLDNPRVTPHRYKIASKYRLTDSVFETILCRLTYLVLSNSPVTYRENSFYDSNLYSK